jgi:hypothetical protein
LRQQDRVNPPTKSHLAISPFIALQNAPRRNFGKIIWLI